MKKMQLTSRCLGCGAIYVAPPPQACACGTDLSKRENVFGELRRLPPDSVPGALVRRRRGERSPERTARRAQNKALFQGLGTFLATLGSYSDDPKTRRASDNFLAFRARDQLLEQQRRQTRAVESLAYQQSVPSSSSPGVDAQLEAASLAANYLGGIERFYAEEPPQVRMQLYLVFPDQRLRLPSDEVLRYSLGVAHIGYASRRAEEGLDSSVPAIVQPVHQMLVEATSYMTAWDDFAAASFVATQYAEGGEWRGSRLDVAELPGPLRGDRPSAQLVEVNLLTNGPTPAFPQRLVSDDQVRMIWSYGYVLRCVEMSMPAMPGGNRVFPVRVSG